MSIDEYITQKKELYTLLFNFLESESESETVVDYSIFKIYLETEVFIHNIKNEFMSLCTLLLKISQNYSIDQNIFGRIEQIISYLGKGMKRYFTNSDFFDFFEKDKRILLYLLSQQLLTIDTSLQKIILTKLDSNGTKYCHFFYPEIKSLVSERLRKKIENELLSIDSQIFENFEEKRKNGQNDSFLCELIRKDSLEEFVTYTGECNVSLSSQIQPSLFETNRFLLKNKSTSLIEYSAFFGSIEIFKYLNKNGVEMSPSLWLYAIHGNSLAIIHLLEENQIKPIDKTYKKCFKESIKCHHNEIANYIKTNFIQNGDDEDVISFSFHYHNYHFFPNDLSQNFTLYYAIKYNYLKIVDFLMKSKDFNCYEPIISNYLLINKIIKLFLFNRITKTNKILNSKFFLNEI